MNEDEFSQKVFGISRFVQIAPKTVLMDLTVRLPPAAAVGLAQGSSQGSNAAYDVYISTTGNMVNPPATTGAAIVKLGSIIPDKEGYGDLFKEVQGELWEWVGRGCVLQSQQSASSIKAIPSNGSDSAAPGTIFAGVVARSSGAWGNEKTVCACSGRTMWEEGRDMQSKSSL
jgi:copper chaperone for superoxide dismutase/copper chaperone